ncbi:MAG TPA: GNAT family N-acetyltransferase [Nitrospirales bacterium]|nr:GNAT family N-acetyltransferase [Nitrospirales bacterium]
MQIQIRPATENDVPLILRFIRDLARYEKLEHKVVATEDDLRATLFGNPRFAEVIFAEVDGEAVGFALFFHNYSTFLGRPGIYLEDLFVKPEMRGHGVGKALLAHLARLAQERGCGRLEWSVLDWNAPAIDFYKRLGAVPLDDWRVFRLRSEPLEKLAKTM